MNFKQKIVAVCLAAVIAGAGIFGANVALAQTDSSNSPSPLIAQMMQMIETPKQQIQQIIALIAQRNFILIPFSKKTKPESQFPP